MGFEWIPETCLACDNQTPAGAAYCSQSCRLADLERASCASSNSSPKSITGYGAAPNNSPGFQLPPAYNFSSHTTSYTPQQQTPQSLHSATYSSSSSSSRYRSSLQTIGLNKYSSRSSLSSGGHYTHLESPTLTDKAAQELKDYANCFDQVRDLKRRMSVV